MATDAPDRVQRANHYLQNISLPPTNVLTGYYLALAVCGLVIKGLALETEGKIPEAIVNYDNVWHLIQTYPNEKSEELTSWTEIALYRASLLKLRLGYVISFI